MARTRKYNLTTEPQTESFPPGETTNKRRLLLKRKPTTEPQTESSPPAKRHRPGETTNKRRQTESSPPSKTTITNKEKIKASESDTLPADLTLLHSSLLTVLLLHHSTSIQPPTFCRVKEYVERLCRRNIVLEDVRKIVFLSHYSNNPKEAEEHWEKEGGLKLVDYGNNKICIHFAEKTKARKLVNPDNLKNDFGARTRAFWETMNTSFLPTSPEGGTDPGAGIPLAEIHAYPKATKVLHAKGRQRLDDILSRHKPTAISFMSVESSTSAPPAKRRSLLLDRIRAKAATAVQAAGTAPSKEEIERIAAEQRIPDIEPILKGLAGRGNNMTLKATVEGIKESVTNPASSKQVEMAVRLIAEREGENGWVKVQEVGKVVGVVFRKRKVLGGKRVFV